MYLLEQQVTEDEDSDNSLQDRSENKGIPSSSGQKSALC